MTFPIRTNGKDVHIVLLNIVNLLTKIVLNDNFVSLANSFNSFNTFQYVIAHIEFTSAFVKAVAGYTYNQVIAKFLGSPEKIYMALMK